MSKLLEDIEILKNRRTKIIATLGPSSNTELIVEKMILAGVNIFRLNMSHGTQEYHQNLFNIVRSVSKRMGVITGILVDLCGPKIRVGKFVNGKVLLVTGVQVSLVVEEVLGTSTLIPVQYSNLMNDVVSGDRIFLHDGYIELKIVSIKGTHVICDVINGGVLRDRQGINFPGIRLSIGALTHKDIKDAKFAVKLGSDFIALSFVRSSKEIKTLRRTIKYSKHPVSIISKIEKQEALDNMDDIISYSDGIMVARGDLGVEVSVQSVPFLQTRLIKLARKHHVPVIVATQMLESMVDSPVPTRAEVQDITGAVLSGTDAIMLSGETASGNFPLESVKIMDEVARYAEGFMWTEGSFSRLHDSYSDLPRPLSVEIAFSLSTAQLSRDLMIYASVVSGRDALITSMTSASRPAAPIVVLCDTTELASRLLLLWGVIPVLVKLKELEHMRTLARKAVKRLHLVSEDSVILLLEEVHYYKKIFFKSTIITI